MDAAAAAAAADDDDDDDDVAFTSLIQINWCTV